MFSAAQEVDRGIWSTERFDAVDLMGRGVARRVGVMSALDCGGGTAMQEIADWLQKLGTRVSALPRTMSTPPSFAI
jgi:hypothetical protein